jgi:hypothetical protein
MRKTMGLRRYPRVVSILGGLAVLLAISGLVAFVSSTGKPALGQSTSVGVDSPPTASVGEDVTITIGIQDITNLGAYEWVLRYDPTLLNLVDPPGNPMNGPFLGSSGRTVFCMPPIVDEVEGTVRFGCVTAGAVPPGPSGSGVLSFVTLTALAEGTSSLCLGYVQLADPLGNDIPSGVEHDSIAVGDGPPSPPSCAPAATPTPQPSPTPEPFHGVISAGASSATVSDGRVTEGSHITVTLTSDPRRFICRRGRCVPQGTPKAVSWIEPLVGQGFIVHLTGSVGQDTTFTYSIQTVW